MKSLGKFTLRGVIQPTGTSGTYEGNGDLSEIQLFDGNFGTGFKVTKFEVWNYEFTSSADCSAILSTNREGLADYNLGTMDASNNLQIGWASSNSVTSGVRETNFKLVDRDNLIIQNLWIAGVNNSTATTADAKKINYYIELEKYDVGLTMGAYSMVRNAAQDMPN